MCNIQLAELSYISNFLNQHEFTVAFFVSILQEAAANHVGTKSKEEVKEHYSKCYLGANIGAGKMILFIAYLIQGSLHIVCCIANGSVYEIDTSVHC